MAAKQQFSSNYSSLTINHRSKLQCIVKLALLFAVPVSLVGNGSVFSCLARRFHFQEPSQRRPAVVRLSMPSDSDMEVLFSRVEEARKTPSLPLLFIDSLVPHQRVIFRSTDPKLQDLIDKDTLRGKVAVMGVNEHGQVYPVGVTATLRAVAPYTWDVRGEAVVKIKGPVSIVDGVSIGEVELLQDEVSASDVELSETLPLLIREWLELMQSSNVEQFQGQVQLLLRGLGPMPPALAAGHRAFWVAALISPLLQERGLFPDIRPAVLMVPTVTTRLRLVIDCLRRSIGHAITSSSLSP